MRYLALFLLVVGCGVLEPEYPKIDMSYYVSDAGVTFYGFATPPDTVWSVMEWWYQGERAEASLVTPDGKAIQALAYVGGQPDHVTILFRAWSRETRPDSLWYIK